MADHDDGAGIIGDHFLQQVERLEIEIIGGFVEHEEVRGQGQGARQHQASALAP